MFQFISVILHNLAQVLVRSAMNQYSFYIVFSFFRNILVLVLVLVNE